MLKKLIKHEFKATSRFFLPSYLIFAAMLVLQRLSVILSDRYYGQSEHDSEVMGEIADIAVNTATTVTVIGVIVMIASPFAISLYRFYKNMLCDQGYLSFTLPVNTNKHLICKTLVACVWTVSTFAVAAVSGLLFALSFGTETLASAFKELEILISTVYEKAGIIFIVAIILGILAALSQLVATYLCCYCSMSIGQCANKHKVLASIGAYAVINTAISVIFQMFGTVVMSILSKINYIDEIDKVLNYDTYLGNLEAEILGSMCVMFTLAIILNVIFTVVYMFLGKYFLDKKLNLE